MTGNLLGEQFDQYVFDQIRVRQELNASGFGSTLRSPEQIQLLNNKTSFLKLASGVNFFAEQSNPTFDEAQREGVLGDRAIFEWSGTDRAKDDPEEIAGGYIKTKTGEENYKTYLEQIKQNNIYQRQQAIAKLKSIGFSESEIKRYSRGANLAKEAILFGGLGSLNENADTFTGKQITQRFGVSTNNSLWNSSAYGLGGSDFGKQPMPGITSATIDCINRGSIRSATVQLKAYNLFQFNLIELLYLRLGFTMMLEWGHNIFLDSENFLTPVENTIIEDIFFTNSDFTQLEVLQAIETYRERYQGNYDGFFGRVSNFNWSFSPDGTYDITLKLITLGDIIESLQINVPAPIKSYSGKDTSTNAPNTISVWLDNEVKADTKNRAVWGNGNYINLKAINYENKPENEKYTIVVNGTKYTGTYQELQAIVKNNSPEEDRDTLLTNLKSATTNNLGITDGLTKENSYFVTFGELLTKIYNNVLPRVASKESYPILGMGLDEKLNVVSAQPNQISFDLNTCFVKPQLYARGVFVPSRIQATFIKDFFVLDKDGKNDIFYGQLMNIYLNFEFIKSQLTKNTNKEGVLSLYNFLEGICDGINSALGDVNKIEPIINAETNTLLFIDQNPIRGNSKVLQKLLELSPDPKSIIPIEIYGFNTENQTPLSNFVKEFKFDTKIDSKLSSMITIGTTAGGSSSKVIDGTAFSNWNAGLQDRFQKRILPPRNFLSPQEAETIAQKQNNEQLEKELTAWWGDIKQKGEQGFKIKRKEQLLISGTLDNNSGADFLRWAYGRNSSTGKVNKNYASFNNRKTGRYKGYEFTNQSLTGFISGYKQWKKTEGKDVLAEEDVQLGSSYQSWLCYAFSGKLLGKTSTDGSAFNITLDQALYLNISNKDFFKQGKQSFKEYIRLRDQKIYRITGSPSNQTGFIPVELGLTIDGLSGVKIYQKININQKFLPVEYKSNYETNTLDFIVTKVNHKLSDNKWETSLSTISIPPTKAYNTEVIDDGLFTFLGLDESNTPTGNRTLTGTSQRFPVSSLSPDNFIREEIKKSEGYYSGKTDKVVRSNGFAYAYPDPGTNAEPYTIGYGQTYYFAGQQYYRFEELKTATQGEKVELGDYITKESAEFGFNQVLNSIGKQMVSNNRIRVPLTQNEYNALLSFSYNSGPGVTDAKKPLYDLINSKDYVSAGYKLEQTLTLNGLLTSRRLKEADIWFTDNPGNPS